MNSIGWRQDTLYISDSQLRRINLFSSSGDFVATLSPQVRFERPFIPDAFARLLSDGSIVMWASAPSHLLATGEVARLPAFRLNRAGAIVDTVLWRSSGSSVIVLDFGSKGQMSGTQSFPSDPLVEIHDDGAVVVERDPATSSREAFFRIHWISSRGDTTNTRRYRYTPVPTPSQDVDSAQARLRRVEDRLRERMGVSAMEFRREVEKKLAIPRYLPPFNRMYLAPTGEIWLQRSDPGAQAKWTVLDHRGDIIGTVLLPRTSAVAAVAGSYLYTMEQDELDVPYLVRYRINRGGTSPRPL